MKMNVAIIGGGIEGTAAAKYWGALGANVTIHDQSKDIEKRQSDEELRKVAKAEMEICPSHHIRYLHGSQCPKCAEERSN